MLEAFAISKKSIFGNRRGRRGRGEENLNEKEKRKTERGEIVSWGALGWRRMVWVQPRKPSLINVCSRPNLPMFA